MTISFIVLIPIERVLAEYRTHAYGDVYQPEGDVLRSRDDFARHC